VSEIAARSLEETIEAFVRVFEHDSRERHAFAAQARGSKGDEKALGSFVAGAESFDARVQYFAAGHTEGCEVSLAEAAPGPSTHHRKACGGLAIAGGQVGGTGFPAELAIGAELIADVWRKSHPEIIYEGGTYFKLRNFLDLVARPMADC
jgi:hypothetical protein